MTNCNPLSTPMEQNLKLTSKESNEFEDATKYIQLVGRLIYVTITRTNISFVVRMLSSFMQKHCEGHYFVSKIVLEYLKETQYFELKYSKVDEFKLIGYSDLDFDGEKESGVSTLGYLVSLVSRTISLRSCKLSNPTDSTTRTEYVATHKKRRRLCSSGKYLNIWKRNM